jgi:hypothetical protein
MLSTGQPANCVAIEADLAVATFPVGRRSIRMDSDVALNVFRRISRDPVTVAKAILMTAAVADVAGYRGHRDDALDIAAELLALAPRRSLTTAS